MKRPVFKSANDIVGVQIDSLTAVGCTILTLCPVSAIDNYADKREFQLLEGQVELVEVYADECEHVGYMDVSIDWLGKQRESLGISDQLEPLQSDSLVDLLSAHIHTQKQHEKL